MFGLDKIMDALPEILKMQPKVEEFMSAWTAFMNKLGDDVKHQDAMAQTIDNKVSFLITQSEEISDKLTMLMSETNLTPELQNDVWQMAQSDPRNAKIMRKDTDGNYIDAPLS